MNYMLRKTFVVCILFLLLPVLFFAYGAEVVDINTASLAQLDNLVGIGPALGQGIIDNRPYNSIDDLLKVKGIGPKNLAKIKQQGLACVNCPSTSSGQATTSQVAEPWAPPPNLPPTTTTEIQATSTSTVAKLPQVIKNYPKNIFITEILPSPEGSDTENEFIEIFNANSFLADVSGFKIRDKIGAIKTFIIPEKTKIPANSFLILKSSQTKISLNNSGDGVELLNPSSEVIDTSDYEKARSGQSWIKNEAGWAWTAKPTPGQENIIISTQTTSTLHSSGQATSSPLVANINNYPPQRKNYIAVGIATTIALSSALIAWRIKKKSHEV
jgi:hypothetical protein